MANIKMKKRRVSYHWLNDMVLTAIVALFAVTALAFILTFFVDNDNDPFEFVIVLIIFFVPIITLFIGLRPVLGLLTVPDVLYIQGNQLLLKNEEEIKVEDIKCVYIHQIGAAQSHLLYYEMTLKKIPISISSRKRKSLIMVEPYNLKYLFQTRLDFLDCLTELGLSEDKINYSEVRLKHMFIRDNFKE